MKVYPHISPPDSDTDAEGAERIFHEFFDLYGSALTKAEFYLDQVTTTVSSQFANAYQPWLTAIRNLFQGVYMMIRKVPLPNKQQFDDALRIFSLESSAKFIADICVSCKMKLQSDWAEQFRQHIALLLQAYMIMQKTLQSSISR